MPTEYCITTDACLDLRTWIWTMDPTMDTYPWMGQGGGGTEGDQLPRLIRITDMPSP